MFKFELMVDYKLQEEDKQRRVEAERIMVENQKKIEEQQRKMVSTFTNFHFLTFPADFQILISFCFLNYSCFNFLDLRNLQEQVKTAFCYQKLFWPFTVWINCSSDLKNFANSWLSASNFESFSQSLEQFFLTVGQNNFGDKVPFLLCTF